MKKKLNEKKNTYSIENPVVPSSRKHSAASLVTLLTVCFVKKKNREKKESQSQNQIPTIHKVNSTYCCSLCEMGDIFQSALSKPEIRS